jgi:hypothetical protein
MPVGRSSQLDSDPTAQEWCPHQCARDRGGRTGAHILEQVAGQTCNFHARSHGGNRGLQQCGLPSQNLLPHILRRAQKVLGHLLQPPVTSTNFFPLRHSLSGPGLSNRFHFANPIITPVSRSEHLRMCREGSSCNSLRTRSPAEARARGGCPRINRFVVEIAVEGGELDFHEPVEMSDSRAGATSRITPLLGP